MAIDAIGVVTGNTPALPQNAGIAQEDFLRILLTQLRFQDPLKPVDNQQFVAQLAQFSALEINRQQSEKIDTLLAVQGASQSVGLIGRQVEVRSVQGNLTGTVQAVSFASGEARLTVRTPTATFVDVRPSEIVLVR